MKLEIKKKLLSRSERVKSVDLHPSLPWVLIALYAGNVVIFDYNQQSQVKSFEITNAPIRCAKFIARKQWIIVGSDDTKIRVYNYNTSEKLKTISNEHSDFVRHLVVHPNLSYVLSCGDDDRVIMFDWEQNWSRVNTYDDHEHYVMQLSINPKDTNMFASASLDKTIKIWTIGTTKSAANFSLVGHQAGVNCVDFSHDHERSHVVSGGDDGQVKVWDYQTKQCLYTFESGHTDNVAAVAFHPDIPIIFSAGEDDVINIWNALTYRNEQTLNYGLKRVWTLHALPGSNNVAIGFDEATVVIKIGSEIPLVSYSNGKVVLINKSDIQTFNLKLSQGEFKDGDVIKPNIKDLGRTETYAQHMKFSPSGRYFAVCGDTDFVVYTYPKFSNAAFGNGSDLVWSTVNPSQHIFAIKGENDQIKIYKNLQEYKAFNTGFSVEGIFGGRLLSVKSKEFITFYDWETQVIVRRIDVSPSPKNVFWSENGQQVVLALEDNYYLLNFDNEAVQNYISSKEPSELDQTAAKEDEDDDGYEEAFQFVEEFPEVIQSGMWVSNDCFVFSNVKGQIHYLIGQKSIKLTNSDKKHYILGYDGKLNRLYLVDKSFNIYTYSLLLSVVNYQSAILNEDIHGAEIYFKDIPQANYQKLAKFLEANDKKEMAFEITPDQDHKFDLAIALNKNDAAFEIAEAQQNVEKWKKVGDIALLSGFFSLAETCFKKSMDYNSLLLFYSSYGDEAGLQYLLDVAEKDGKFNVAYECAYLLALPERCIQILTKSKRFAEAAMFARTYIPIKIPEIMKQWEEVLKQNQLQFVPENIFENQAYQQEMVEAQQIFQNNIDPQLYKQPKGPADEIELQRDRWYQDFQSQPTEKAQIQEGQPDENGEVDDPASFT